MLVEIEAAHSHEKSSFSTPTSKYPSISVSPLASRGCAAAHTTEGPNGCTRLGTDRSLQDNGSKLTSFLHSCAC